MAWRDIADRVNVAVVKTFGETVSWTPALSGVTTSVVMHFESAFFRIETDTSASITTQDPHAYIRIADLPSGIQPEPGDTIVAQGSTYKIVDGQLDGYGAIRVWLREIS